MGLQLIITGATGMVGEGVLHECLLSPAVDRILLLSRRNSGVQHPKLSEVLVTDFFDLRPVETQLAGYDACLFCLGVSSVGMKKEIYEKLTYDLTLHVAKTLLRLN